ncbi:uncharacterized protein LOC131045340 [Cryptomeria japonica]|uniref:uncharacterized protein LOC131045340 n=1 Tax=Cryptomeria japonica TaxID=3369 RepID=UPI0025AD4753|nr:uncharacterized protein LOC131045340 [Cryptomeria japonica]
MEQPFRTFDNQLLNGSRRWGDVHSDQNEERNRNNQDNGGINGNEENDGDWNNTNRGNIINNNGGSNRYGSNQKNRNNGINNDNYGNGNGGGRNNNNGNGGNHRNNGNNNGGGNNWNNGNGIDSAEQHAVNVKNIIEEFEVPHEDLFIKLKNHYEILSHKPNTLQQAFKTTATIENIRKVFSDDGEDIPSLRKLFQEEVVPSLSNLTKEEKKASTIAVIEQVKSNYQLRNRNVNNEQGKLSGIFARVTKSNVTNNDTAKGKDTSAKKGKEPK